MGIAVRFFFVRFDTNWLDSVPQFICCVNVFHWLLSFRHMRLGVVMAVSTIWCYKDMTLCSVVDDSVS